MPTRKGSRKKRMIYGQPDRKGDPPPPYSPLLVICFGVCKKTDVFGPKTLFQALFGSKFSHFLTVRAEGPP